AQSVATLLAALHDALRLPQPALPDGLGATVIRTTLQTVESTLSEAPALVVLDNLETPWERQQSATEKILAQLAAIPGVALVASVRSGDAPIRPHWGTRLEIIRLGSVSA
ncbi:MAG: hypothetical protein ACRDTA_29355, partial [Pseudonocardiaceae bacterium]